MYELYRSEAVRFYACSKETSKCKIDFKNVLDAKNSVAETKIRVHQKTQRGCGDLNFALNFYHTTSRMMANGKHTEIFLADHKKIVESIMELQMVHSLDSMLKKALEEQLNNMADSYPSKINQSSPSKKHARSGGQLLSLPDMLGSTHTPQCDNSVSGSLDYCPSCKEMVNEGVACDICGSWYHYTCENLSESDMLIIETQREFYCSSCKHEHGEELLAEPLMQDSMRNDDTAGNIEDIDTADNRAGPISTPHTPKPPDNSQGPAEDIPLKITTQLDAQSSGSDFGMDRVLVSPDAQAIPVLPTGSGLTEAPISLKTTDHMPTAPSSDQNVQHPSKNNRQKRTKRNTEQNDNTDQLKLAQLLIGNLEQKVSTSKTPTNS